MINGNAEPSRREFSLATVAVRLTIAMAVVGLLVAYSMYFQVSEGYNAVVTRFGNPVRSLQRAGLAWKFPWPIERVHEIDARNRLYNTPYTATLTRDQKNVILLTYVVWRVEDPLLFLQSLGAPEAAEQKLDGMVAASKNFHLGRYELSSLVATTPGAIRTEAIERAILGDIAPSAREKFGMAVEQVGIKARHETAAVGGDFAAQTAYVVAVHHIGIQPAACAVVVENLGQRRAVGKIAG